MFEHYNKKISPKFRIQVDTLLKSVFFFYMCGLTAFNRGYGVEAIYCRLIFIIYIVVAILVIIRQGYSIDFSTRSTFRYFGIFITFQLISSIWAKNINDAWNITYISGFAQILGVTMALSATVRNSHAIESYLKIVLWSIFLMGGLLVIRTPFETWGSERVGEVMGLNPNTIGTWCAIGMVISLHFIHNTKFYIIGMFFLCALSLFSGSRTAFVMIILGIFLFNLWKDKGWRTIRNLVVILILVGILLYLVFNNELLYNVLGQRLEKGLANIGLIQNNGIGDDTSAKERSFYKQYAIDMFWNKPLLGWGSNGFVTQMRNIGYSHVAYSHCNYTELLANLGIVGFILFYAYRIKTLVLGIILFFRTRNNLVLIAGTIIIIMLLQEYQGVTFYDPVPQIIFSLMAMLIYKIYAEEKSRGERL